MGKAKIQIGLGLSPLTDKIYYGKQNPAKNMWVGQKKDITDSFIDVMFQYIKTDEVRTITTSKESHLFIHTTKDRESINKTINHLKNLLK